MRAFNAALTYPNSEATTHLTWSVPEQALGPVLGSAQFVPADVSPLFRCSQESVRGVGL